MIKEKTKLEALILVGLTVRTNNKNEMNPATSKIAELVNSYWSNQVSSNIKHRASSGVTYSVYTEYESDEHGEYSYFIGERVSSIDEQDSSYFKILTIPESHYQKFTTVPGEMLNIVIDSWKKIWTMEEKDLGGKRSYIADFEVYDQRAADSSHAIVDIYIGVEG